VPGPGSIDGLVRFVAAASEGERNRRVLWAACRAGELVAKGLVNPSYAEALIVEAAICTGLDRAEAKRSVVSGMSDMSRTGGKCRA